MDTENFLFFATLAESQSLTDAARRLNIDRSGVSRRLKALEAQAHAQLVVRDTRNMALTTLGKAFYTRCAAVRDEIARAQDVLGSSAGLIHGPLHVSCPPAITRTLLAPVLRQFCHLHPAVSLQMTLQAGSIDLIDKQIDVAMRFTNEPEPQYVARPMATTDWLLCASPTLLQGQALTTLEQLEALPWLGIRSRMEISLQGPDSPYRLMRVSRMSCGDYAMLRDLCHDGLGVAMLPAYVASKGLADGSLTRVLQDFHIAPTPGSTLYAITLQSRYMPPQARALVSYLKEQVRLNAWDGLTATDQPLPASWFDDAGAPAWLASQAAQNG